VETGDLQGLLIAAMSRMGAGQSTSYSIEAVSERHKGRVGQFRLNKSQRYAVKVTSQWGEQLSAKKNLMDLSKLLSDQAKCQDLLVVSSRALEDEFTRLRFPDPERASKYISTFFWQKDQVEQMQQRDSVQTMCQLVVGFLLRLVTLVAAVTASMHSNEEYLLELTRKGTTSLSASEAAVSTEKYGEPLSGLQQIMGRTPMNQAAIGKLKTIGALLPVPGKNTLRFKGGLTIAINPEKAVLFRCYGEKTPILGIEIEPYVVQTQMVYDYRQQEMMRQQQQEQERLAQLRQQQQQQQPQQQPQVNNKSTLSSLVSLIPNPLNANRSTVSTGQRSSGGARRRTRRRQRIQRGGEDEFFVVRIMNVLNCAGECTTIKRFLINTVGDAYEIPTNQQRPEYSARIGSFNEVVERLLVNQLPLFTNEDTNVRTTLEQKEYGGLYKKSEDVYGLLNDIKTAMKTKPEGASPANYRAFLLATGIDNGVLSTLFCNDVWSAHRFTNTIAYSLLNSLYIDRDDGVSESETRLELAGTVSKFVGEGVARPYLPASNRASTPQSFDQIAFPNTPRNLSAFCEKLQISPSAITVRKTSQVEDIEILTKAHEALRELQNKHIEACVNLMRKVLSLKTREIGQPPVIHLEETFFKHEQGARAALEELIGEARALISTHYLNIEIVYRRALQDLGRRMTGNYSPANAKNQTINTNVNRLNKAKNLLNEN